MYLIHIFNTLGLNLELLNARQALFHTATFPDLHEKWNVPGKVCSHAGSFCSNFMTSCGSLLPSFAISICTYFPAVLDEYSIPYLYINLFPHPHLANSLVLHSVKKTEVTRGQLLELEDMLS